MVDSSPIAPPSHDDGPTDVLVHAVRVPGFARQLAEYRRSRGAQPPLRRNVEAFVDRLLGLLFPQLSDECDCDEADIEARLTLLARELRRLLLGVVAATRAEGAAEVFFASLPGLHERLCADAEAMYTGDPAAESFDEVVAAYPGFLAIAMYRIAHELHGGDIPLLPRLIAEIAHGRTGIDIHPGARIGRSFCIDHGTGVVVGETAVIGDEVKLYQGVTLGAVSVHKNAAGSKRHPTVEDRVVIYANATILGGDTVVGHDSTIGGNVWLPHSVPPYSFVHQSSQVRVRRLNETQEPLDFVI